MVNRVVLVCRLTKDPELRRTNSGLAVASLSVAFENRTKNEDGSKSTSFINCTAWRNTAEFITNYCKKGMQVCIDGRLQERKYQRKDNTTASVVEIVIDNIDILTPKSKDDSNNQTNKIGQGSLNSVNNSDDSSEKSEDIGNDLADDDLPF